MKKNPNQRAVTTASEVVQTTDGVRVPERQKREKKK